MNSRKTSFNLVDEPWLPIVGGGCVSLRDIFSPNATHGAVAGDPVQKIALTKLLLAIAQAAATPESEIVIRATTPDEMAALCLAYLEKWRDRFDLRGETPFLQMPAIQAAAKQSYGAVRPEVASGNTTVLLQSQIDRPLNDAEKAILLVRLTGFALGGKKTDNSVTLTPGYLGKFNDKGKPASGKPGPSLGFLGLLHSFVLGKNLRETIFLNLLSTDRINGTRMFPGGVGIAPWEDMPDGEDCPKAKKLRESLMGRLIPLSRFVLLADDGLHYSEGIIHLGHKDGVTDPSCSIDTREKEPMALWTNPEKRPWRELTSLLSFIENDKEKGFQSLQLRSAVDRAVDSTETFKIWSGGLRVSSNAGEQFVSGSDDFVESIVTLNSESLGDVWFSLLKTETSVLDELSKMLYGRISGYFRELKSEGKNLAAQASNQFWRSCEDHFQALVDACDPSNDATERLARLRRKFCGIALETYDRVCARNTARQMDSWIRNRPDASKFLRKEPT
jgi:CRISPR system Cascade subunit CasA